MSHKKYEALQNEAWTLRKSVAQVINEALDMRFGWHPDLFEEPPAVVPKKKAAKKKGNKS